MIRLAILVFCLLQQIIWFDAKSQFKLNSKFGLRVGANFSRFTKTRTNDQFHFSYNLGVAFEKPFNHKFSFVNEIAYSRQGNIALANNPSINYTKLLTKYDYLVSPFLIRYKPQSSVLFLTSGIQIAYLINNETIFLPTKGFTNNSDPLLRRWDAGLVLGTGFRLKNNFHIDLRYFGSFSTLYRPYNGLYPITGSYVSAPAISRFNQVISLNFSHYFIKL